MVDLVACTPPRSPEGETIYTASTDKTVGVWDTMTGERIKRMKVEFAFPDPSLTPSARATPAL